MKNSKKIRKFVEILQNLLIFITLLLSSIPVMVYTVSNKLQEIFSLFNRSLNLALHRAPLLLFSVEKKKNHFEEFLDCL